MSLVLGYVNENYAIVMSDGRAGENGSYSEHYNKTIKINDNIIIGFAGIAETIEIFIKHCLCQMGDSINEYYMEDFIELLEFLFDDSETKKHLESSFLIIGLNKKRQFVSCITGKVTNYKIEFNLVTCPRALTIGGTIDGEIISATYLNNIEHNIDVEESMRKTIMELSLLDSSINQNIFIQKMTI